MSKVPRAIAEKDVSSPMSSQEYFLCNIISYDKPPTGQPPIYCLKCERKQRVVGVNREQHAIKLGCGHCISTGD